MSIRSLLLRLVLSLVLVLDGTAPAMAAAHMSQVDMPVAASQEASTANADGEGEPCYGADEAKVATTTDDAYRPWRAPARIARHGHAIAGVLRLGRLQLPVHAPGPCGRGGHHGESRADRAPQQHATDVLGACLASPSPPDATTDHLNASWRRNGASWPARAHGWPPRRLPVRRVL